METISIADGLVLTVVAMLVVIMVLASIWGFVELVAKLLATSGEPIMESPTISKSPITQMTENPQHKKVAEVMALIIASKDKPNKKFEIVQSKRIK